MSDEMPSKWLSDKESTCQNAGYVGLISGSGRSHGVGNGNPLWYSHLGNPMDRGAWPAPVLGLAAEHKHERPSVPFVLS